MNLRQHAALTTQLMAAVGGVKIAASVSRLSKSSFYKAEDAADIYCLPADVILVLEDYAGTTVYTSALHDASAAASPATGSVDLIGEALGLSEDAAHFVGDLHRAKLDGMISPREVTELTAALTAIQAQLTLIGRELEGAEPSNVVAVRP